MIDMLSEGGRDALRLFTNLPWLLWILTVLNLCKSQTHLLIEGENSYIEASGMWSNTPCACHVTSNTTDRQMAYLVISLNLTSDPGITHGPTPGQISCNGLTRIYEDRVIRKDLLCYQGVTEFVASPRQDVIYSIEHGRPDDTAQEVRPICITLKPTSLGNGYVKIICDEKTEVTTTTSISTSTTEAITTASTTERLATPTTTITQPTTTRNTAAPTTQTTTAPHIATNSTTTTTLSTAVTAATATSAAPASTDTYTTTTTAAPTITLITATPTITTTDAPTTRPTDAHTVTTPDAPIPAATTAPSITPTDVHTTTPFTAAPTAIITNASTTTTTAAPITAITTAAPISNITSTAPTNLTTSAVSTLPTLTAASTTHTTTTVPTYPTTTVAPTTPTTPTAPTHPTTTVAPTSPTTTVAPTTPTTTTVPTHPTTTVAPTSPTTTVAPTTPTTTTVPTHPTTTVAPTSPTTTVAPTSPTTTVAPTTPTTTTVPTHPTTTVAPTSPTTTVAPTTPTTTTVPTHPTTTVAPTSPTTTVAPTSPTTTAAPTPPTTTPAPTNPTTIAVPTTPTSTAALTSRTTTAAPTTPATTTITVALTTPPTTAAPTPPTTTPAPTSTATTAAPTNPTTTVVPTTPTTTTSASTTQTTTATTTATSTSTTTNTSTASFTTTITTDAPSTTTPIVTPASTPRSHYQTSTAKPNTSSSTDGPITATSKTFPLRSSRQPSSTATQTTQTASYINLSDGTTNGSGGEVGTITTLIPKSDTVVIQDDRLPLILGLSVAGGLILIVITILTVFICCRVRRATKAGRYLSRDAESNTQNPNGDREKRVRFKIYTRANGHAVNGVANHRKPDQPGVSVTSHVNGKTSEGQLNGRKSGGVKSIERFLGIDDRDSRKHRNGTPDSALKNVKSILKNNGKHSDSNGGSYESDDPFDKNNIYQYRNQLTDNSTCLNGHDRDTNLYTQAIVSLPRSELSVSHLKPVGTASKPSYTVGMGRGIDNISSPAKRELEWTTAYRETLTPNSDAHGPPNKASTIMDPKMWMPPITKDNRENRKLNMKIFRYERIKNMKLAKEHQNPNELIVSTELNDWINSNVAKKVSFGRLNTVRETNNNVRL